jgi:chloramphenicol O-acetyltransferase type A
MLPTERFLDLATWPRRAAFEFYRGFDKPYFSVCTRIDVTALKPALAQAGLGGTALALHHLSLQLAHRIEPFRYRLQQGRVRVLDAVHGSTTVLRADESFGFAYLQHADRFPDFVGPAAAALQATKAGAEGFAPRVDDQALLHFTTLPWLHFTSFSHARNWGREDSIPKVAFGRIDADGGRRWLPLSVEVHHALMDGLHVGRFVQGFEAALRDPLPWLQGQASVPGTVPSPD